MDEATVQFSVTDINNILGALGKIPAEYSMNLIMFIKQQADAQLGGNPPETEVEQSVE